MAKKTKANTSETDRAIKLALRIEYEKNRYNWLNPPMPTPAEVRAEFAALDAARAEREARKAAVAVPPTPPLKRGRAAAKHDRIVEALCVEFPPHGAVPESIRPNIVEQKVNTRLKPQTAHRKTISGVVEELRAKFGVK
jgi:hypothetical protein